MNMHLTPLEFIFVFVSFGTWTNATQTKTHKSFMEDSHQTIYGGMLEIVLVEIWLWIDVLVIITFV